MTNSWRRYEVLIPLQFNDGRDIPPEWLAEAVLEVVEHFGAASYETQKVEGHWRQGGVIYRDNLVRVVVDVPDSDTNRDWMKQFKSKWKTRFEQLELWMISYPGIRVLRSAQEKSKSHQLLIRLILLRRTPLARERLLHRLR